MQTLTRLWYNQQMSSTLSYAFSSPHAISPHLWSFSYADHASSLMEATWDRTTPHHPWVSPWEWAIWAASSWLFLYIWPADNASCSVGFGGSAGDIFECISELDKTKITKWTSSLPKMWEFGDFASDYPEKGKKKPMRFKICFCTSLQYFSQQFFRFWYRASIHQ